MFCFALCCPHFLDCLPPTIHSYSIMIIKVAEFGARSSTTRVYEAWISQPAERLDYTNSFDLRGVEWSRDPATYLLHKFCWELRPDNVTSIVLNRSFIAALFGATNVSVRLPTKVTYKNANKTRRVLRRIPEQAIEEWGEWGEYYYELDLLPETMENTGSTIRRIPQDVFDRMTDYLVNFDPSYVEKSESPRGISSWAAPLAAVVSIDDETF